MQNMLKHENVSCKNMRFVLSILIFVVIYCLCLTRNVYVLERSGLRLLSQLVENPLRYMSVIKYRMLVDPINIGNRALFLLTVRCAPSIFEVSYTIWNQQGSRDICTLD